MGLEELLNGASARRRAVVDRLRRAGVQAGTAGARPRPDPAAALADVHREHVASLLTAALAARLDGRPTPPEASLDAATRLGPAVERWGLAAEVALLTAPPGADHDRRLAAASLALAPTAERRRLAARAGLAPPGTEAPADAG